MNRKKEREDWQAQEDAYTMARYHEIMSDKERAVRAVKAAEKNALALDSQAKAMRDAAKVKVKLTRKKK